MASIKSLTWHQVNAWRLSQHGLSPRLKHTDFLEAATRTGGVQAQLMSAAQMALGVRVEGLTTGDVQSALWEDRTLIKTWAMRGTLHLLAAADLPLYVAARSVHADRNWLKYFLYFGITEAQSKAFMDAVPQVLGSQPMTREQLATGVAHHLHAPELARALLSSSWGSLWKPSALRGDLCFGPNQGQKVTFVNPGKWIGDSRSGEGQPVEPYAALQEIARRYLRAYGPATPENFALWWDGGGRLVPIRKLFESLKDELETVDVEGRHALALRRTLEPMEKLEYGPQGRGSETVRLLPLFDAYTLGIGRDIEPLLSRAHKSQVYRPQGWISAVVLVDGRIQGVWEHKTQRSQTTVKIRLFPRHAPAASIRDGIESEAERMGAFLNTTVALEFASG